MRIGASQAEARTTIAYHAGNGYVHIRAGTCREARRFAHNGFVSQVTAGAWSTILHEALHRQGLRNERVTECYANVAVKYTARIVYLGLLGPRNATDAEWRAKERIGNRAQTLAFNYSTQHVASSYQMAPSACLALARAASWADYRDRQ